MEVKDIQKLIRAFTEQGLSELEVSEGEFSVKMKREIPAVPTAPLPVSVASRAGDTAPVPSADARESQAASAPSEDEDLVMIESPIIGTFYRSPNPDADPYVNVGDTIRKGQVLCIIEAMKIMNEIEAEIPGVIVKIFPKNGEAVEYGQKLFAVRPV